MVGGGSAGLRPGEIGLAHGGTLFLDELGEFPTAVLDALRQPLEDGVVRVSRSQGSSICPARFLLVAAMNPCPCGEGGVPGACRCSPAARARYARRLSGPLLDRFDITLRIDRPDTTELVGDDAGESTAVVAARVAAARVRSRGRGVSTNAELDAGSLERFAPLDARASALVERHLRSGGLSARGLHRVRRLARTVADLDGAGDTIGAPHVAEALYLRGSRALLLGEEVR
jgi:magnesium chelatase family protein